MATQYGDYLITYPLSTSTKQNTGTCWTVTDLFKLHRISSEWLRLVHRISSEWLRLGEG